MFENSTVYCLISSIIHSPLILVGFPLTVSKQRHIKICQEPPGYAWAVTRSQDEKEICKAALPRPRRGCPRASVCPFLLSVLLLLDFLLIFGNKIHSNKASLQSPSLFGNAHDCSGSGHDHKHQVKKTKGHTYSLAACLKDYNVLEKSRSI